MNHNIDKNRGIHLLKKGQKGLIHALFSRLGIIIVLLLLQAGLIIGIYYWFEQQFQYIYLINIIFAAVMMLWLLNSESDPTSKITWLIFMSIFPVFGSAFYLYTKNDIGHKKIKKHIQQMYAATKSKFKQNEDIRDELCKIDRGAGALTRFISHNGGFPVYHSEGAKYFSSGEEMWNVMLDELSNAKDFIFLEYFIIDEGIMWGKILNILADKVKEGVDVRVLYDGTCEFSTLPYNYPEKLAELGITCRMFGPLTPFLSTYYNYRDHRKIMIIDGKTAFTGGVNLADEYINAIDRFGHWKDAGVMIRGEAVMSFSLMFLQLWYNDRQSHENEYKHFLGASLEAKENTKGYVIPYGDNPIDKDRFAEKIYIDILNRSQDYIYIMSPYLILDGEVEMAIRFAAERGTDVRIILPSRPDKIIPYALAKTHYSSLLNSGVKLYEYLPGFIHSKVFLSDDTEAVVGSINLDYRSLYHHFECAAYMYDTECIADIAKDFEETFAVCRRVSYDTVKNEKLYLKIIGYIFKTVAPLL